jgi:hypothetical protein
MGYADTALLRRGRRRLPIGQEAQPAESAVANTAEPRMTQPSGGGSGGSPQ